MTDVRRTSFAADRIAPIAPILSTTTTGHRRTDVPRPAPMPGGPGLLSFWQATSERQLLRTEIMTAAADLATDDAVTAGPHRDSRSSVTGLLWRRITQR